MMSYDVTVIGGGINGVGIAQTLAAAGYKVLLIEKGNIGEQTSSKSSKLIHGGLRYLESGQLTLVFKALRARAQLLKLAPTLVKPIPFVLPVYSNSKRGACILRLGLGLYGLLSLFDRLPKYNTIASSSWNGLNGLTTKDLKNVFTYWDAQTDDQKLTIAVADSALSLGVSILQNTNIVDCKQENNEYQITYASTDKTTQTVKSRMIINASGPWLNDVLTMISPKSRPLEISYVQGTHILIDVPAAERIFYLENPPDQRGIFVMPWYGKTLVGTTEVELPELPEIITPTLLEIDYLTKAYRTFFPNKQFNVINAFSGVRVLTKGDGSIFSRERSVKIIQNEEEPNLINIIGGKLTTYRDTAEQTLKKVKNTIGSRKAVASVNKLSLK